MDVRRCRTVLPPSPRPGRRWIGKPEFLDAFPLVDRAMPERGFYWVYRDAVDHYGGPKAIAPGNPLHSVLTPEFGFHPRAACAALSRAGLYAFNWSAANPEKISAIYANNAAADFKSWPAGWSRSSGGAQDWGKCRAIYSLSKESARQDDRNPVDRAAFLTEPGFR